MTWPHGRRPGLARATFFAALAAAARETGEPAPPPVRVIKPGARVSLTDIVAAAIDVVRALGMPEMWSPIAKGVTLFKVDEGAHMACLRVIHRPATFEDTIRERLNRAADALEILLAAVGRTVRIREIVKEPNIGGLALALRLMPQVRERRGPELGFAR